MADAAPSGDLGFTCGPWSAVTATGAAALLHGYYVSIWKRDGSDPWRIEFDGKVTYSGAAAETVAPDLPATAAGLPPPRIAAGDPMGQALRDFQDTVRQDTLPGALRTYARDFDFRFFADGLAPGDAGTASESSAAHAIGGDWRERAHGRSVDSTMAYSVGELVDGKGRASHGYVQIWQYDPKVANWGLRILLINQFPNDG